MIITQDHIFTIGSTHKICQDYALSGTFHTGDVIMPFIIVSDGCSSSKDTDIGARLLCHAAKMWIRILAFDDDLDRLYKQFGQAVITSAKTMANTMGLPTTCLDATLIVSFVFDGYPETFIYGDGHIFAQNREGEIALTNIEFESNAPFYLSYWIDSERRKQYDSEFNQSISINFEISDYDSPCPQSIQKYDDPIIISHGDAKAIQSLTISSDGLGTFYGEGNIPHPPIDVVSQLIDYKIGTGEFLQRRARRVLKNYSKQQIHHSDDLSLAAFFFKEE